MSSPVDSLASGEVEFYLPAGTWTNYWTGEPVTGGTWRQETHGFGSLPLYVRDGAVLVTGARSDRPDYDYLDGLVLEVYPTADADARTSRIVTVTTPDGAVAEFTVDRQPGRLRVTGSIDSNWAVSLVGTEGVVAARNGEVDIRS